MKKNLMSIIILALVVVNLVLTAIIMFSVVSANRKTVALVDNIAAILDLEMNDGSAEEEGSTAVSVTDTQVYDIADSMTIALRPSSDGTDHYALVEVSFSLNKTSEDFETYQPLLAERESKIKSEIIDVIGSYTKEEAMADIPGLQAAILQKVQNLFGSDFVYEAYFRDIKFQ